MELFKKYIDSNYSFYKKNNFSKKCNIVLFLVSKDIYTTSLTMRFAKARSDVLKKNLIVIPNITLTSNSKKTVQSFYPSRILDFRLKIFKIIFLNLFKLLKLNKKIIIGEDLINLKIDEVRIGKHLYDYLLVKYKLLSVEKITLKHRFTFSTDILYYLCSIDFLKKEENPIIILPDNVYRHGAIFEYAKNNSLNCLTALSLTEFTIHKFDSSESFKEHCRTPSLEFVEEIISNNSLMEHAKKSFEDRILGVGDQHDVIRAYAKEKIEISREELINIMRLNPEKPIILVAAHIFSDAPHANNDLIFKDFYEWLLVTCLELKKNNDLNFVIKEHPTSNLYGESNKTFGALKKLSLEDKLLPNNIKTNSLFNLVDVLITCGGTAAMEFAYHGIPNLIASKPPYYKFGFSDISESKTEYINKLKTVHEKRKLSTSQRNNALAMLYIFDKLQKMDNLNYVIGSQKTYLGVNKDLTLFMEEMIEDTKIQIGYKSLKESLSIFFSQRERNLISNKLIHKFNLEV